MGPHSEAQAYQNDGTRMVRIIGCDYKLLESEILDWLVLFGEVVSEITEEVYGDQDDPESKDLPPVGNGNYLVKMKLKKELPNWLPIYGKRICLEYRGNRKQCSWCFGFHMRKYCKNEKMGLEEYVDRFKIQHPEVPDPYYGKLSKSKSPVTNTKQPETEILPTDMRETQEGESRPTVPKLTLRRDSTTGATWEKIVPAVLGAGAGAVDATTAPSTNQALDLDQNKTTRPDELSSRMLITRIATGNAVNSMLSVIRATFKQNDKERVETSAGEKEKPLPMPTTETQITNGSRSSSAARGRGVRRDNIV